MGQDGRCACSPPATISSESKPMMRSHSCSSSRESRWPAKAVISHGKASCSLVSGGGGGEGRGRGEEEGGEEVREQAS